MYARGAFAPSDGAVNATGDLGWRAELGFQHNGYTLIGARGHADRNASPGREEYTKWNSTNYVKA
jgi:hypothetical protein